jgi:hypothetical protein
MRALGMSARRYTLFLHKSWIYRLCYLGLLGKFSCLPHSSAETVILGRYLRQNTERIILDHYLFDKFSSTLDVPDVPTGLMLKEVLFRYAPAVLLIKTQASCISTFLFTT